MNRPTRVPALPRRTLLSLLLPSLLLAASAQAQTAPGGAADVVDLDAVQVNAYRVTSHASSATKTDTPVAETAQSISVIAREELDALRLTAAEHQALQTRWAQDTQTLEAVRTELASARADLTKERERREQAEADALRASVRLDTLEQLLAQLRPDHVDSSDARKNPATQ